LMKNYCYLGCSILTAEVCSLVRKYQPLVDLKFIPAGFHEQPGVMHKIIQEEIERIEEWNLLKKKSPYAYKTCDAILLGFGLCEKAAIGLHSNNIPLVIPKAHDCITLLLGSRESYRQYFTLNPATYWFSPGWVERMLAPGPERETQLRELYSQRYDPAAVDYLMDEEKKWQQNYKQAAFISGDLPHNNKYRKYTKKCARYLNWSYKEFKGDPGLLKDLLTGNWDDRFLVINPGEEITASFDEQIIKSVKCEV
jgi:hypothetical protein